MTDPIDKPEPGLQPESPSDSQHDTQQVPCPGCHRMRPRDAKRCPHCGLQLIGELAAHLRHVDDELHGLAAAMAYPAASTQAYFGATPNQLTERYRSLLAERSNVLHGLYAGATDTRRTVAADTASDIAVPTSQEVAAEPSGQAAHTGGPHITAEPYSGAPTVPYAGAPGWTGYTEPPMRPETSPNVVQNTLLALGGLLLGAAAITFTVLAWDQLGIVGRSVILGIATAVLLTAPAILARRELRATAETVVVLGLLLLALDGYAAWRAVFSAQMDDYAGGADWAVNGFSYSAAVAALVGIVGLCYQVAARVGSPPLATRPLVAPPLVAAAVAHTIPPLVALGISTTALSFAIACLVIAAADVVLLAAAGGTFATSTANDVGASDTATTVGGTRRAAEDRRLLPDAARKLGYPIWRICVTGAASATIFGVVTALAEIGIASSTTRAIAGAGIVLGFAVVLVMSGWSSRSVAWSGVSAALALLLLGWAAALLVQRLSSESSLVVVTSSALGLLCAAITVVLPQRQRIGATIGTGAILGLTAIPVAVWTLLAAWGPVGFPDIGDRSPWDDISDIGLRMLCAVVLICLAWALLQWRWRLDNANPHNAGPDNVGPEKVGVEAGIGPALLAIAVFTTTIGPLSAAPLGLLIALPLCGALMVTGMGLLDTGITREGTFAAGLLLSANALARGVDTTSGTIGTLIAVVALYTVVALFTGSGGVRVTSTTVASVALLALSAPLTAAVDGSEILAGYLVLLGVITLLSAATIIALTGNERVQPASVAMEVVAGIGGFFALMLTLQERLDAALVSTALTGLLVALALRESRRTALWWSLAGAVISVALWLRAAQLSSVEAYTLPLALALLGIGLIAHFRKPDLPSWVTFGPALLLGTIPTLIMVLFGPPDALRALLLGLAAVTITTIGAFTDRQAPFVLGAITVAAVAVRVGTPLLPELTAQLPVWVPLAAAGALLLGIGASYERGRRDMRRLVDAIRRMD